MGTLSIFNINISAWRQGSDVYMLVIEALLIVLKCERESLLCSFLLSSVHSGENMDFSTGFTRIQILALPHRPPWQVIKLSVPQFPCL